MLSYQKTNKLTVVVIASIIFAAARVAMAHPNHGAVGWVAGVAHPFTGIDHILAMLAVGLWAAQRGGRSLWLIPCTFLSLMFLGGLWAAIGEPLPVVESGIAASVLILGLIIASATRLPTAFGMSIVGAFAIFHGFAHITDAGLFAPVAPYAIGLLLATASLHGIGLGLGLLAQRLCAAPFIRAAGAGIAVAGILLLAGIL